MATYADLKTRVITEMAKDNLATGEELAGVFAVHISEAIDEYSDRRFWFNQTIVTTATVANTSTLAVPATIDTIDRIEGPYGDLDPVDLAEFQASSLITPGYPGGYTYVDGLIRFSPTPDAVYDLTIYGVKKIAAPTVDADSNAWTNEAQGLIAARTRFTLYRDVYSDDGRAQKAIGAVQEQLAKLQRKTDRRIAKRLVARLVGNNAQSVRRGWLDRL